MDSEKSSGSDEIGFTTSGIFRTAFSVIAKHVQELVEKAVKEILKNPEQGKLIAFGVKNERIQKLNGHTLAYAYNSETKKIILLNVYERKEFFK